MMTSHIKHLLYMVFFIKRACNEIRCIAICARRDGRWNYSYPIIRKGDLYYGRKIIIHQTGNS